LKGVFQRSGWESSRHGRFRQSGPEYTDRQTKYGAQRHKINAGIKGVGSAKPVPNNNTPEGQSKNRRVELNFSAG
jgi:hypothetical protein